MSNFTLDMLVEGLAGELAEWVAFESVCRYFVALLIHMIHLIQLTQMVILIHLTHLTHLLHLTHPIYLTHLIQ